jgi:hypothetical protein
MPERLPPVDVVLVGFGWTASILAQELTEEGLDVLAIERGGWRDTPTDFPTSHAPEELRYYWRHDMFLEAAVETQTFRNNRNQIALPIRRWGSYLPGVGVGGHCTPVYPYFYVRHAEELGLSAGLASLARRINDDQARWAIERLDRHLGRTKEVEAALILGLGFRPQVKEHTFSTAFLLREELERRGARVWLNDPLYSDREIREHGFEPLDLDGPQLPALVILNTALRSLAEQTPSHSSFSNPRERSSPVLKLPGEFGIFVGHGPPG